MVVNLIGLITTQNVDESTSVDDDLLLRQQCILILFLQLILVVIRDYFTGAGQLGDLVVCLWHACGMLVASPCGTWLSNEWDKYCDKYRVA